MAPVNECVAYAVHDAGNNDSQFFTIDLMKQTTSPLGGLYSDYDIEGLDIHPTTQQLYAVTGSGNRFGQDGYLYMVDSASGALYPVGPTGFSEVVGLSFRRDGTLWGWSERSGLIEINIDTGRGTLVVRAPTNIEALAWNKEGTHLYGASGTHLWLYTPGARPVRIATNLPGITEALDMRPDGLLIGGVDRPGQHKIGVFSYDVERLEPSTIEDINTPYDDIESIAWPEHCNKLPVHRLMPLLAPTGSSRTGPRPVATRTGTVVAQPTRKPSTSSHK